MPEMLGGGGGGLWLVRKGGGEELLNRDRFGYTGVTCSMKV